MTTENAEPTESTSPTSKVGKLGGPGRISRDDIEAKLKHLQDQIQGKVGEEKQTIVSVVVALGAVIAIGSYLLGRRSGRKKSAFVEIRRG